MKLADITNNQNDEFQNLQKYLEDITFNSRNGRSQIINPAYSESAILRILSDSLNTTEDNEGFIINNVET